MRKTLLILLSVSLILSCNSKTAPSQNNPVNAALEDTRWQLIMLSDFPEVLPATDKEVYIIFEEGKISGFAGCNSFFGSYSSRNETIKIENIGSTKMYCEKTMALETAFLQALTNADKFTVTGVMMELHQGNTQLARFQAVTR
jgi:heat shock protein HslJ